MRLLFFGGGSGKEGRRSTVYDDVTPPKKMYLQAHAGEEAWASREVGRGKIAWFLECFSVGCVRGR